MGRFDGRENRNEKTAWSVCMPYGQFQAVDVKVLSILMHINS